MPFGKTLELIAASRQAFWRVIDPLPDGASRDRLLSGKDRIRARKAARRHTPENDTQVQVFGMVATKRAHRHSTPAFTNALIRAAAKQGYRPTAEPVIERHETTGVLRGHVTVAPAVSGGRHAARSAA